MQLRSTPVRSEQPIHRTVSRMILATELAVAVLVGACLVLSHATSAFARPNAQVPLEEDRPWECRPGDGDCFCVMNTGHEANPPVLLAGEAVTVSIPVNWVCGGFFAEMVHIMMVVDTHQDMTQDEIRDLRLGLKTFVEGFNLAESPTTRIGLILVDERARTRVRLTDDESLLFRWINRIQAEGELHIDRGIRAGQSALLLARRSLLVPRTVNDILIIASHDNGRDCFRTWKDAASNARNHGILLITLDASNGKGIGCLRTLASSARYYYVLDEISQLRIIFDRVRGDPEVDILLREMHLVENLAPGMEYLSESASPAAEFDPATRKLVWRDIQTIARRGEMTFTYRARAMGRGQQTISRGTNFFWKDVVPRCNEMQIEPESVSVFGLPEMGGRKGGRE